MEEIWKDIIGYEGIYRISNLGRVLSLEREVSNSSHSKRIVKAKILNSSHRGHSYDYVHLCKGNKYKREYVHRLVAKAFISNPNRYLEVNHKNENKHDNRAENLEWCNRLYNVNYGTGKRRKIESRNAHGCWNAEKPVHMYSSDGMYKMSFDSIVKAARYLSCAETAIRPIIGNNNRSIFGYMFSFDKKDKIPSYKKTSVRAVKQLTLEGEFIKTFSSLTEAARSTGTNLSKICDCLHGRRECTNGFKWEYNK